MAAAGPRGRDGPSPREFATVRHFMMAALGLSGLPLLVYARIDLSGPKLASFRGGFLAPILQRAPV